MFFLSLQAEQTTGSSGSVYTYYTAPNKRLSCNTTFQRQSLQSHKMVPQQRSSSEPYYKATATLTLPTQPHVYQAMSQFVTVVVCIVPT